MQPPFVRGAALRSFHPAFRLRAAAARLALPAAVALCLGLAAAPGRAQIITENAGVVSPQTPEIREAITFLEADSGRELAWINQLIVSSDRSNEFKLTLPWIQRSVDLPAGDLDLSGFGDLSLRWKHALWKDDEVMRSTRWSTLLEIGVPSGDSDDTDGTLAVPDDLLLSRGDWSIGGGTAFTKIVDRNRFAADLMVRHHTSHDGFQLGDTVDLDLAYWYRLSPARFHDLERTTEVRGVIELLSSYRFGSELHGVDADDDGWVSWLAPGLQVYPSEWLLLEASVALPIAQTFDDAYGDRRFAAVFSLKVLF